MDKKEIYDIIRVGIYLPETNSKTGIGVIPKTHISKGYICKILRFFRTKLKKIYFTRVFQNVFNYFFTKEIIVEKGDCIFFMANIYHRSLPSFGKRQAFFLSYGGDSKHSYNYHNYYYFHREDSYRFRMSDKKIDINKFENLLKNNNLYLKFPNKKEEFY